MARAGRSYPTRQPKLRSAIPRMAVDPHTHVEADVTNLIPDLAAKAVKSDYAANVKTYGAVGDGVADDTAAIQAAINAHGSIYLPGGAYKVTSTLSIPTLMANRFSMVGESSIGTYFIYTGTGAFFRTDPSVAPSSDTRRQFWHLSRMYIKGPGASTVGSIGLLLNNAVSGWLIDVTVSGFETGVRFDGLDLVNGTACYYNGAYQLSAGQCGTAIMFAGRANSNQLFGGAASNSVTGIWVASANNISVHGTTIESNSSYGLNVAGYGCQFLGCRFENDGTYEVKFDDSLGGVSGTKNTILSYWTEPDPTGKISWDAGKNNTIIWPGLFNDLKFPDSKLVASTPYTIPYAPTIGLAPVTGNNPCITATGDVYLVPLNGALDGQEIVCSVLASGVTVYATIPTATRLTTGLNAPFGIPPGEVGFFKFRYTSLLNRWALIEQTNTLTQP